MHSKEILANNTALCICYLLVNDKDISLNFLSKKTHTYSNYVQVLDLLITWKWWLSHSVHKYQNIHLYTLTYAILYVNIRYQIKQWKRNKKISNPSSNSRKLPRQLSLMYKLMIFWPNCTYDTISMYGDTI